MVQLKGNEDSVLDAQLPKATEEQILELEGQIGCSLPPDYRAFLKIHNGSLWHTGRLYPSPNNIEEILWSGVENDFLGDFGKPWQILEFPTDGSYVDVVPNLWHPALITIIEDDGAGYVLRLDTGEILWWDHDGWSFQYVAASFEEFLKKSVEKSVASGEPDWWMDWQ
jgi:cell wall assembly regulator SMI1